MAYFLIVYFGGMINGMLIAALSERNVPLWQRVVAGTAVMTIVMLLTQAIKG